MSLWLLDTGVWLRLAAGANIEDILGIRRAPTRAEILASPVTLAEVVSVLSRQGRAKDSTRVLGLMRRLAQFHRLDIELWEKAGRIHSEERAHTPELSLADALILAQARDAGALLVTTDAALAKNRQRVRTLHVRDR